MRFIEPLNRLGYVDKAGLRSIDCHKRGLPNEKFTRNEGCCPKGIGERTRDLCITNHEQRSTGSEAIRKV
jgi:hypothetical protein